MTPLPFQYENSLSHKNFCISNLPIFPGCADVLSYVQYDVHYLLAAFGVPMSSNAIPSPRPLSVMVAMVVLGAAWLLRLYLWSFGADWKEMATYTSLAYCGPFTLFLLWVTYRGRKWGRALLGVLYLIHLQHWLKAMRV